MSSLAGRLPKNTFKDLLQVSNSNSGVDSTLRDVEDGEGTVSALQLSTTKIGATFGNTNFKILDTNASHTLAIVPGSDLTDNRTLTITTGDADRTLTLNASGTAYVTGGTDVALADGGTGASLVDPNADRIMFWDDSGGAVDWLSPGTGLSISGTTLNASVPTFSVVTQVFTSSGTYTPTANMKYCIMKVVGGGGGGAGCAGGGAGTCGCGDSGAGGGMSIKAVSAATVGASQTVTIGAAGTAGASGANSGGNGGTSSVGTILTASGGVGGTGRTGTSAYSIQDSSRGGDAGIGADGDVNLRGNHSALCISFASAGGAGSGGGGSSPLGCQGGAMARALSNNTEAGLAPPTGSFGCGGSGGATHGTGGDVAGGAGSAGIVIITEFVLTT